jgi:hypothetical protein
MEKLSSSLNVISNLVVKIENAEKSRIQPPSQPRPISANIPPPSPSDKGSNINKAQHSQSALVSPIQMLSRGYLGEEIAILVQYLVQYKNKIINLCEQLKCFELEIENKMQLNINQLNQKYNLLQQSVDSVNKFLIELEASH